MSVVDHAVPPAEVQERRRPPVHGPLMLRALLTVCFVGVVMLDPPLPANAAMVDPFLALAVVVSVATMLVSGSHATRALARALPWMWLIVVGSFLALTRVGITFWAMSSLIRTIFAILTFFALWHLIDRYGLERAAVRAALVGLVVATFYLLTVDYRYRAAGLFPHPNYAGHFAVIATAVIISGTKSRNLRLVAVGCLGITLWQTGSFGAVVMVGVMLSVLVLRVAVRNTTALLVVLLALAVGLVLFVIAPGSDDSTEVQTADSSWEITGGFSQKRLDKSSNSRFEIWANAFDAYRKEPLGVGPDGVRARGFGVHGDKVLEIHSDSFGYLVERGPLGLVGFIGLWAAIWRAAPKGGIARVIIAAVLVSGLFRETMHYRHMWILLALAMVLDYRAQDGKQAAIENEVVPA